MSPSFIATTSVPAVLKYEFEVEKVTTFLGFNALKCAPAVGNHAFFLYMDSTDEDSAPILTIHYMTTDSEKLITQPVYPFEARQMPERVQGLINMAEQWLVYLDTHSF